MTETTEEEPSLAAALTREHRDIDAGIEAFVAGLDAGEVRTEPLLTALHALRRHIYLEEEFLFPPLRNAGLMMPIMVMLREHGVIWQAMDALTDGLGEEDSAASTTACRELLAILDQHNTKEEPIIYPQGDVALGEDARAELIDFLRHEDLPDGWVCQQA